MSYRPTESLDVTWKARNSSWRRLSVERRRYVTNVPARYAGLTIADLPDDPAGHIVTRWLRRWQEFPSSGLPLEDFDNNRGRGLWLHGDPGTGKTTMASVCLNHLSDLGWSSKFVTMSNLYDLSLQALRARGEEEKERWQSAYDCYDAGWAGWRIVVLDDLGKEHKTASRWAEDAIDSLLRNRFNDGAPTIVTTNMPMRDIGSIYNVSLRDFIYEAFIDVEVTGGSYRRGER